MAEAAEAALVTRLEMRIAAFEQNMTKAIRGAHGAASKIEQAFAAANDNVIVSNKKVARSFRQTSKTISDEMKAAAGTIAASFTANEIAELADEYTRYTNQLKTAGLEGQALSSTQEKLYTIAQKYGVELEALGTLYGRTSSAAKELGASNEDLMQFSDGVSAAMKIQGGDAAAASGALLQLAQMLGGANVQAEEFNSVLDGARPIVQTVANNIDRMGGSVSKLKTEINDGKVTSAEFFRAFLKGSKDLEQQAAKAELTISASWQIMRNALAKYVGEANNGYGATAAFSGAIKALADNLNTIIPALVIIAATMAGRYVGGMVAAQLANVSFTGSAITAAAAARAMGGALLGAFGGPVGLAITALTVGITAAVLAQKDSTKASQNLGTTSRQTADAILKLNGVLNEDPSKGVAKNARDLARARIEQASATYEAAKAEIALRKTQAQERLKDLEDGAEKKKNPRGIVYERPLSTMGTRAGTELGRERLRASKAIEQASEDMKALDETFKSTIKAIKDGKGSPLAGVTKPDKPDKATKAEEAEALARKEGRYVETPRTIEGVESIDVKTVDDTPPLFVASGGLHTNDNRPELDQAASGALEKASDALEDYRKQVYDKTYDSIRGGLQAAFEGGVPGVLAYFGRKLQEVLMDRLTTILTNAFTKLGGAGGGGGGGILSMFAGFFANGGTIPAGKVGIAGEAGAELIKGPATVLSHNKTLKALSSAGGASVAAPIVYASAPLYFDLSNAVLTSDLLEQMNAIGQEASVRGAQGGAAMAQAKAAQSARSRLGRR